MSEKVKSRTAIEREAKEVEMLAIIAALEAANFPVERINDLGTLAYMVKEGALEGRFITLKVVLTKEYNEEKGNGFDIADAIELYNEKLAKSKD